MKSVFAIRQDDALWWHATSQEIAGRAQRAGFRVRAINRRWHVWATDADFKSISEQ
jgi:hypothetical protein